MIQSNLEQKTVLAAHAVENDIQQLTANQLVIARKMILVISKETATLSMVIPFIRVLLRSWEKEENSDNETLDDVIPKV